VGHLIEPASSGRAKCRGCGRAIAKGELRLGERLPNPFSDEEGAERSVWFHLRCGAYKRPEVLLAGLEAHAEPIEGRAELERAARFGLEHRRLPRLDGAERASSARAKCRHCKATIDKGAWRLRIVYFEEGMVSPGGFVHATCSKPYFETTDIMERVRWFSPDLGEQELAGIERVLGLA
jgi:hypothetical protein